MNYLTLRYLRATQVKENVAGRKYQFLGQKIVLSLACDPSARLKTSLQPETCDTFFLDLRPATFLKGPRRAVDKVYAAAYCLHTFA
jgi:hypothetical protein